MIRGGNRINSSYRSATAKRRPACVRDNWNVRERIVKDYVIRIWHGPNEKVPVIYLGHSRNAGDKNQITDSPTAPRLRTYHQLAIVNDLSDKDRWLSNRSAISNKP